MLGCEPIPAIIIQSLMTDFKAGPGYHDLPHCHYRVPPVNGESLPLPLLVKDLPFRILNLYNRFNFLWFFT